MNDMAIGIAAVIVIIILLKFAIKDDWGDD